MVGRQRLTWAGQRHLGAEVILDAPDEDALVESLAQLLWAHRDRVEPDSGGPSDE
jgi:hypothetical protein